jgi:Tfp pilus assembly protein PilN
MNRINLIPPHRRKARAKRVRLRGWITINVGYAFVLGLVFISVYAQSFTSKLPAAELTAIDREVDQAKNQLSAVRSAIAHAQQIAASSRDLSDQPDWSRLLAPLANSQGNEIVLGECDLSAIKDDAAKTKSHADRMSLHLVGLGRSQWAVAQFMLRLEAMGLFDHVNLVQSSREQFMQSDAVKFELNCPLRGRMGGSS